LRALPHGQRAQEAVERAGDERRGIALVRAVEAEHEPLAVHEGTVSVDSRRPCIGGDERGLAGGPDAPVELQHLRVGQLGIERLAPEIGLRHPARRI
jgi:hypothetical protein